MKQNKILTNMVKLVSREQKMEFIINYGVLRTVGITIILTMLYATVAQSIPSHKIVSIVLIKVIIATVIGYIYGLTQWHFYRSVIDNIKFKDAYRKWYLINGITGFSATVILVIFGSLNGLLRKYVWLSVILVIGSIVAGLVMGYLQYRNADLHTIRRIAVRYKK